MLLGDGQLNSHRCNDTGAPPHPSPITGPAISTVWQGLQNHCLQVFFFFFEYVCFGVARTATTVAEKVKVGETISVAGLLFAAVSAESCAGLQLLW